MTQIHKVYLMWPHSGTSGIITFTTNEPFFGAAVPYSKCSVLCVPLTESNSEGATFCKLFHQHTYAILCHVFAGMVYV